MDDLQSTKRLRDSELIKKKLRAYTIMELALVVLIVSLVYSTASPVYYKIMDDAKSESSNEGIQDIAAEINKFIQDKGFYPDSLEEVLGYTPLDPWGNPYQYLRIDGFTGLGKMRKDKNLVPINSDYDLFSMGPDGKSVPPLTANSSKDDIVRGRNGKFFGTASDY